MPPMFQGTVIDAETIYLGMKIEEGFKELAKAVDGSDDILRLISAAIKERPTERGAIGSLRDQAALDSVAVRAEIKSLKVALVKAMQEPDPVPVTPNDLAKESA